MSTILDPQKKADIFLIRGDDSSINLSLSGVDLTGATVFFTAKPTIADEATDATAVIEISVTSHTDPTAGTTVIPLSSTDTDIDPGTYYYDIQIVSSTGEVTSIPVRKLQVFGDITRRVV